MANDIYEQFLRLAGFEEAEIPQYLPEWRKAAEKLGLTEDDVRFAAEEWIPDNFEIEFEGVRKVIGGYLKEAIELTKANEYKKRGMKIVYGILPATFQFYHALKLTAPDKVFISFPDIVLLLVMNALFHKLNPYLERAEKDGITYGCRHCALNKTRYAARRSGLIPSPDLSWIWGFICDEGPKTDEFIQLYRDPEWKTYITRLPHDQPLGTVEDEDTERIEYLASQMRDGFEFVQKELDINVPDEKIREAVEIWQRYARKLSELNHLMASDPQPLGGEVPTLLYNPIAIPFSIGVEHFERALDILIEELKQKVANKEGILPKGAPKLMAYFIPYGNPWIGKMFEQNGVGLTFHEMFLISKKQLTPPSFEDPFMATAEQWLRRSATVNLGYKAKLICEKLETYGADGMIFGFFDFDRWWGSDQRLLSKMVEERTKLPVFYIEGDVWEDRDYSPEALRTRIESIAEIVKMRKDT